MGHGEQNAFTACIKKKINLIPFVSLGVSQKATMTEAYSELMLLFITRKKI